LTQQVEEKEIELRQERESVCALSKQLQGLQATSASFEALAAQGKQILDTIGEQQAKADEQRQKSVEELRDRYVFLGLNADLETDIILADSMQLPIVLKRSPEQCLDSPRL
jgi:hypothetical protein